MRDVEVLASLVLRHSVRIPGGGETEEVSIRPALKGIERKRGSKETQETQEEVRSGRTAMDTTERGEDGCEGGREGARAGNSGRADRKRRAREGEEAGAQRRAWRDVSEYTAADGPARNEVNDSGPSQIREVETEEEDGVTSDTDGEPVPPPVGTPISRRRN